MPNPQEAKSFRVFSSRHGTLSSMKQLYMGLILIAMVLLVPRVHACSCIERAECGVFNIRDKLFVSKALSDQVREQSSRLALLCWPSRLSFRSLRSTHRGGSHVQGHRDRKRYGRR